MSISTALTNDKEPLKSIVVQCFAASIQIPEAEKRDLIDHIFRNIEKHIGSSNDLFLKSHDEGTVNGFILVKGWWNLSDLFVSPDFHGRGIGRQLLSTAITICSRNSNKAHIHVNSSLYAEGFYRKSVFKDRHVEHKKSDYIVPLQFLF